MNLKKFTVLCFSICLTTTIFASDSMLYVLNPDPYSQALGGSILSLSPSVFGFFTNPASNYKNISKELQFSYMSYYKRNYGANVGIVLPTEKYGNFSMVVSGMDYNKENNPYKNFIMAALNYVYPITKKYPIPMEKGAIGATVKVYKVSANTTNNEDKSAMLYSADFGFLYSLDFIDNNLMGAIAFKNFGNNLDFDFLTEHQKKQTQIFTASTRYLISSIYKVSLMADMVKRFQATELGYACGLETTPFYPFSLRIGWRDYRDNFNKGITAGFSLNFDKVNIAYSFSDILNSSEDQHIFSLGIAFGKVDNVGKAYEHYLGYYLRQAKDNYDNKNYIAARKQFEDILAVYPNEPITKQYLKLLSKIVEQTDINFSEKVEKYIATADKALLKNNLIKARKYYSKALLLDSKNSIAKEGILNVSKKIEEQRVYNNRKKHQKEITKYWIKAVNYYDKGDFVYAKDEFNKILEIDPTNAGALQYLEFVNKKIEKVNSLQTNNIFKQGVAEFNEGNYEKALSFFNAVSLADPSRTDVQDYISKCNFQIDKANNALLKNSKSSLKGKNNSNKQIKKEMKDIYNKGLEHLANKDYVSAFETFAKLKIMANKNKIYDYNKQINDYISMSVREISKQLYEEGEKLEMKEQLEQAYEKYKSSSKYDSSNEKAKSKLEQLKTVISQKYYEEGLKYFSKGNKQQAISAMKKALQYEPNKNEVNRFLKKIRR